MGGLRVGHGSGSVYSGLFILRKISFRHKETRSPFVSVYFRTNHTGIYLHKNVSVHKIQPRRYRYLLYFRGYPLMYNISAWVLPYRTQKSLTKRSMHLRYLTVQNLLYVQCTCTLRTVIRICVVDLLF